MAETCCYQCHSKLIGLEYKLKHKMRHFGIPNAKTVHDYLMYTTLVKKYYYEFQAKSVNSQPHIQGHIQLNKSIQMARYESDVAQFPIE